MAEDQQKAKQTEAVEEEETKQEGEAAASPEANATEANGKAAGNGSKSSEQEEVTESDAGTAEAETDVQTPEAETDVRTAEAETGAPENEADDASDTGGDAEAKPEAAGTDDAADQPASDDDDDDSGGRLLEEAVSAATSEMEVPAASEAGVTIRDDELVGSVSGVENLEPTGRVGYTGEIVGRVVRLEDLEEDSEEDRASTESYKQLMLLVDESFTQVTEQEIVRGRVVSVGEKDVVIDIGFKSDGVVSLNEFSRELSSGDEVEVFVDRLEDYHGQLVLSKTKADQVRRWQRVEEAYDNEQVLDGTIVRRIKGGMIVELFDTMEAFLPGSQIDVRPVRDFDAYLGTKMEFKIVKLNPANENIVVSHKALIERELEAQRTSILSTMESGQILEGIVKNITDFGVFIDLGGVDGLLHITDLSWGRVSHPSELVDLDQKLNVVVLDYDKERQRISLGLKQLQPHPWEDINEKYTEGETVEGKVVSITDYGAFVELEKGIEGLVHISEMSWTEHIRHPSQMVSLGQLVKVKILNIDKEGKKISLGMKQLEPDPWTGISERYPPGTVLRGKVRNITNFGVFVEIEPGIDGLVHISDLSWTKKIRHPSEMIKKGQDLDVVILNVDEESRRISLGHKQVETNPWNQFAKVYAEGTDTMARVVRSNEGGLVVELPMEVEAFVPASELKNGPQDFQEFYQENQEIELRVIKFDPNQKEIVLSEAAKDRAEERADRSTQERERRDERQRERREVSEFKKGAEASGPTTLGELSGLADLKAQIEEAERGDVPKLEAKAGAAEAVPSKPAAESEAAAETQPAEEVEAAAETQPSAETEPAAETAPAADTAPAKKESIPEAEDDEATIVDEGPTPEQQAEAEMEESDETVVTTAAATGQMENTPGTKARGRAGKRKEQAGDHRVDESKGAATEPPASRAQRREDAGDVLPAEKSKASTKGIGETEKEGAAEAADAATQDKTPTKDVGDKPIASIEGEPSVAEIESRVTTEEGKKAVTKDKVIQSADDKSDADAADEGETDAVADAGDSSGDADENADSDAEALNEAGAGADDVTEEEKEEKEEKE